MPGALVAGAAAVAVVLSSAAGAEGHRRRCPDCDIPFEWDDGASSPPAIGPFPQGFALTVPVTPGGSASGQPTALDRYAEVAVALGRCWSPILTSDDARWRDVTLRVSFRRDGAINGVPKIVHVSDPADAEAQRRGRQSLLHALGRCTPLPLSPSLGRAIAGQIFAIRFVQQRKS